MSLMACTYQAKLDKVVRREPKRIRLEVLPKPDRQDCW